MNQNLTVRQTLFTSFYHHALYSNRSHLRVLTHTFQQFYRSSQYVDSRAPCLSIRIESRISNSVSTENRPDRVCLCNEALTSAPTRAIQLSIGIAFRPATVLTSFTKTPSGWRWHRGCCEGPDDNGRGLSRDETRSPLTRRVLLVSQPDEYQAKQLVSSSSALTKFSLWAVKYSGRN